LQTDASIFNPDEITPLRLWQLTAALSFNRKSTAGRWRTPNGQSDGVMQ
jgi:hypothetical protein